MFDFEFDQVKDNSTQDNIFQVIEMFIEFKLNMQTVLDPNFHFHLSDGFSFLYITVVVQNSKI